VREASSPGRVAHAPCPCVGYPGSLTGLPPGGIAVRCVYVSTKGNPSARRRYARRQDAGPIRPWSGSVEDLSLGAGDGAGGEECLEGKGVERPGVEVALPAVALIPLQLRILGRLLYTFCQSLEP
jgi:hypothetical protein